MAKQEAAVDVSTGNINLADLVAALKAAAGNDPESLRERAKIQAEENEKLREWENKRHPHISAFSNPGGDIAEPKPALKCKMLWNGHHERADQLTPEEVAVYNLAKPGVYQFKRTTGEQGTLTVEGKTGPGGDLQSLEFTFPCRLATDSLTLKSKPEMLREAFGMPSEAEQLRAELAALKAQKRA